MKEYGPKTRLSRETHELKYRTNGESFEDGVNRFASTLTETSDEYFELREILLDQRFMGGGRTQSAIGSTLEATAFNCFVSGTIKDDFDSIMDTVKDAGRTMRKGGGYGYDFSTLRPAGAMIKSLNSVSSGPIAFMNIFDSTCQTISAAGHRRGAQMGVLRVDHPDVEQFIIAKQNSDKLTAFNISLGITDEFMRAVRDDTDFDLVFEGVVYKTVKATLLWEKIMRATWDWAEPGVLYIDRINEANNLYYCEYIAATNPCGEQPLPPHGACLLGSFNLTKYIKHQGVNKYFDYPQFIADIPVVIRAMDKIHDKSIFPLEAQAEESRNKRRMGIGLTGVANALEALGLPYGSVGFMHELEVILKTLRDLSYESSALLAMEKGAFPLFDSEAYMHGEFIKTLPKRIRDLIKEYGIRNSHILSMAPTGTISLTADNVSGGIEPVFSHSFDRTIQLAGGPIVEKVMDYAYRTWGVKGKTANECTADDHLNVLALATKYVDSAVSKTINVSPNMPWNEFKSIYMKAWELGCKGCTTFNSGGKRYGVLNATDESEESSNVEACFIDPETGQKECS